MVIAGSTEAHRVLNPIIIKIGQMNSANTARNIFAILENHESS